MKSLSVKLSVLLLGFATFAAMPRTASADSFTLDGVSLDFLAAGPGNSITVEVPAGPLAFGLAIDNLVDITVPELFLDDTTTGTIYDLKNDLIIADEFSFLGPSFATIDFSSAAVITPEPSEITLLCLGLLALAFSSKKMRAAKALPATA